MNIAVLYLAWLPYGTDYFNRFLDNYIVSSPGHKHKLVILFNGIQFISKEKVNEFKSILASKNIPGCQIFEFDKGQDIAIYLKAAHLINADYFLFLNTYTKFEAENWLYCYVSNWKEKTGLIGATGSYASYLSAICAQTKYDIKSKKPLIFKLRSLKYLLKISILHGNKFKNFPSPHIRTNAFFTSKNIICSFKQAVQNKMEAYYFENGKESMTVQVLKKGLDCLIIDKYGKSFPVPAWPLSKTFWIENQENLLISDNQTKKYAEASAAEKRLYNKIAWGI